MTHVTCLHCDTILSNQEKVDGWCETCGKKLPSAVTATAPSPWADLPRPTRGPLDYPDFRRPPASPARDKARKEAAGILFAIAALQLVCGFVLLVVASNEAQGQIPGELMALAVVEMLGIAAVFAGLGGWALHQPLPASVVGLILYIGLTLLTLAANPHLAGAGLAVKLIFIIALIKAISASARAR
jgi:hypothetical protein